VAGTHIRGVPGELHGVSFSLARKSLIECGRCVFGAAKRNYLGGGGVGRGARVGVRVPDGEEGGGNPKASLGSAACPLRAPAGVREE